MPIVSALVGQNQCNYRARAQTIVYVHRIVAFDICNSFSSPISARIPATGPLDSACYPADNLSSFEQERGS